MKLGRWSTIAGNNNAAPPDGCPEGQAPSTLNDCMRENMAAIRAAFNDLQFFDQDYTPTQVNATTFSVPGNQTSAIHAGRRLKLFDAQTLYGTVSTASFTTVTTIHVEVDDGATLTSSLSSFGISVMSNSNNGMPRHLSLSTDTLQVADFLSVGGVTRLAGFVAMGDALSVSATAVAPNIAKAIFCASVGAITSNISLKHSFNVASVSRSATGSYRVNFVNPFNSTAYTYILNLHPTFQGDVGAEKIHPFSQQASSLKFYVRTDAGAAVDIASHDLTGVFYGTLA